MTIAPPARSKKAPHVPAQYYGYSLQTTRCLARLFSAPRGSCVSIEVFEDVGVIYPDGSVTAEQDKSALEGNPVADRAVDLWKTLSNWVDAILNGEIDANTTYFEIFVAPFRTGAIVELLHAANVDVAAVEAFRIIRASLWGDAPNFPKKAGLPVSIAAYVNNVLLHKREFLAIIPRFHALTGSGDCHADVRGELEKWYPSDAVDDIYDFALGWVKRQLDQCIVERRPALIEVDVFREQLVAFFRRTDPRRVLRNFAQDPTQEHIEAERALRTYVKQLELVNCDHVDQVDAVIDYFRAAANRTIWSKRGYINAADLVAYEDGLTKAWRNLQRRSLATRSHLDDAAQGRALLSDCLLHECPLTGAELPEGFTRGSFHTLADTLEVGWHPNYLLELDKGGG